MNAYVIKEGALGPYWDRQDPVPISYDDVSRWTQLTRWGDSRTFLVANLKDGRSLVVVQKDNPQDQKGLAKISKEFRHQFGCKIGFVRNDLTTNLTDALAAITPADLDVYYKIEDDLKKARAAADKLRQHPADQSVTVQRPSRANYPADSLDRLMKAEFIAAWDHATVYLAHFGRWNPQTAKLYAEPRPSA